jgi:hypothetical protein
MRPVKNETQPGKNWGEVATRWAWKVTAAFAIAGLGAYAMGNEVVLVTAMSLGIRALAVAALLTLAEMVEARK